MIQRRTIIGLSSVAVLTLGIVVQAFLPSTVGATEITVRSLTLQAGTADGGSKPSGVVNHYFQFTLPSTGVGTNIGSIKFLYCTLPGLLTDPCTTPAGLDTTNGANTVTLADTGSDITGWTLNNTTNGAPYISLASATAPTTGVMKIKFSKVTNPSATNTTFFVRIASYASLDVTGAITDSGTVAASTATPIVLTGTMPESLIFCTGATIVETAGVPDCSTATSGAISFNQLFSPTSTSWATSQMAASTNAGFGYAVTVNGATMTSGSNTITAVGATPATSQLGIRQFGMNLVADNTPAINYTSLVGNGSIIPASDGVNYMGAAATNFDTLDNYTYDPSALNIVAKSDNGTGTGGPTDAQIYTSSYIVNVSGNQPAGSYTTTLTYICTPTF